MRVGDWVEVRSEAEILQTLDEQGRLEGLPFMPEMFRFCGQRMQIYKCAHKTCDGISQQSRRLARTVHLETRCSGEAHGGCQSACLLFWKEDWLRPLEPTPVNSGHFEQAQAGSSRSLSLLKGAVVAYALVQEGDTVRYRCQTTQIRDASEPLAWWDLRQYVSDIRSGNVNVLTFACGVLRALRLTMSRSVFAAVRIVRWLYVSV